VRLYSTTGQRVSIPGIYSGDKVQLDISNLEPNLYFISVGDDNTRVVERLMVR